MRFASTSAPVRTTAERGTGVSRPKARWFACLATSVLLGLASAGCEGSCDALAERICGCELNSSREQACLLRMQRVGDREVSPAEGERCSALLDTCDCDALDREDFGKCGLSNEPTN